MVKRLTKAIALVLVNVPQTDIEDLVALIAEVAIHIPGAYEA